MTAGSVLAGGRSSRFGRDKLRLALADGRPLIVHAVEPLRAVCSSVVVVAGTDASGFDGLPADVLVVPDREAFGGPVAGLLAGLTALALPAGSVVLVAGGDMPTMREAVLMLLSATLPAAPGSDCVRLALDDEMGPPAVMPCALRAGPAEAAARIALETGDRRLRGLLGRLATTVIASASWRGLDPDGSTIRDIDRPADLAAFDRGPAGGGTRSGRGRGG